jgi:hypothetical protein
VTYPHLSEALPQLALPGEVAPFLHRTTATVRRQLANGELPGVRVGGRWFVQVEKLAEQLDANPLASGRPAPRVEPEASDLPVPSSDDSTVSSAPGRGRGLT